jgi:hypothetical protein
VRRHRPLWLAIPAALVIVAVAVAVGLRVHKSDAEKIEGTSNAFQDAFADRDSAKACEQVSPRMQEMLREQIGRRSTGCEHFFDLAFKRSKPAAIHSFSRLGLESVEVRGDIARATYKGGSDMTFERVGESWLVYWDLGG